MGLFSFKKTQPKNPERPCKAAIPNEAAAEKEHLYEVMVQKLLKESKTSMGPMGKGSTQAAVQMLLPNELPVYAILTNVSLGDPSTSEIFDAKSLKGKNNGVLIITAERLLFAAALSTTPISKALNLADITVVDDSDVTSVIRSVLRVETPDTILAIDGNKQVLTAFCAQLEASIQKAKRRA